MVQDKADFGILVATCRRDPNKIRKNGTVLAKVPEFYKVQLDNGIEILATVAARFRVPRTKGKGTMKPRIYETDKVVVEIPLAQTKIERGTIVGFSKISFTIKGETFTIDKEHPATQEEREAAEERITECLTQKDCTFCSQKVKREELAGFEHDYNNSDGIEAPIFNEHSYGSLKDYLSIEGLIGNEENENCLALPNYPKSGKEKDPLLMNLTSSKLLNLKRKNNGKNQGIEEEMKETLTKKNCYFCKEKVNEANLAGFEHEKDQILILGNPICLTCWNKKARTNKEKLKDYSIEEAKSLNMNSFTKQKTNSGRLTSKSKKTSQNKQEISNESLENQSPPTKKKRSYEKPCQLLGSINSVQRKEVTRKGQNHGRTYFEINVKDKIENIEIQPNKEINVIYVFQDTIRKEKI
ncbi:6969_t:CDS:2 [Scutellospora calospora]|uniref:6969_t:CDS:1 n=1 Tax=Scutellospora calospora TaxID=85575 RepID=A0ACA9M5U0_9GLOM|nr:6969_t:CDS:2 [Scutellospora calospora]